MKFFNFLKDRANKIINYPNDWELRYTPWYPWYKCHCGKYFIEPPIHAVCPACGCKDKIEIKVAREEWLFSQSRLEAMWDVKCKKGSVPWVKEVKFVDWTFESCCHGE